VFWPLEDQKAFVPAGGKSALAAFGVKMSERRVSPRIEIEVEMEARENGDVFPGTSVNVSETGILIQTNKDLNPGEIVTVRLICPGEQEIVGIGKVVRNHDLGFGKVAYAVQWDLTRSQKDALREVIMTGKK